VRGRDVVMPSSPPVGDAPPSDVRREGLLVPSAALVVGFWWLATGLIVAIQRDPLTRAGALVLVNGLALLGTYLLWTRRERATPAGARQSLLGGAFLWTWVWTSFYSGWLVGPGVGGTPVAQGPTLALAMEALRATSHNEIASVAVLVVAWALTRGASNRVGLHALLVFFGMHQLARLNVFIGVVNPATRFLPERLLWLADFFGPPQNSPLLAISVVGLGLVALGFFRRAATVDDPFRRQTALLLAILAALGAGEHVLIGVPWDAPLWDVFLRFRTGAG